jgi:hypothetical protein
LLLKYNYYFVIYHNSTIGLVKDYETRSIQDGNTLALFIKREAL